MNSRVASKSRTEASLEGLREALSPAGDRYLGSLQWLSSTTSTNDYVRGQVTSTDQVAVCIADSQTSGRGRRGRVWSSSEGSSLCLSIACLADTPPHPALPLAVGAIVHAVLVQFGATNLSLKWPNDIVAPCGKLAGILVEANSRRDRFELVVGIGINWTEPGETFAVGLDCLVEEHVPSRHQVAAQLVEELSPLLVGDGKEALMASKLDYWKRFDAYRDRAVILATNSEKTTGVARGIDESGALLLETAVGLVPFHIGDVSLRRDDAAAY